MIKLHSYAHSVMINYFDMILVATISALASYTINEVFGNVVYACVSLFLLYATFDTWQKIINPVNWYRNCWYNGGK